MYIGSRKQINRDSASPVPASFSPLLTLVPPTYPPAFSERRCFFWVMPIIMVSERKGGGVVALLHVKVGVLEPATVRFDKLKNKLVIETNR